MTPDEPNSGPMTPDEVMSPDEIREKWERNGLVQRSRGTLLHFQIEAFLNMATIEVRAASEGNAKRGRGPSSTSHGSGSLRSKGPPSPEFCQFLQIYDRYITATSRIYRTELSLFHCGLRLAGQVDCLCRAPDGSLVIWDSAIG